MPVTDVQTYFPLVLLSVLPDINRKMCFKKKKKNVFRG